MLDHEMEAFGRRLGLESLSFSSEGVARLDIANIGSFYLEKAEHDGRREILAYLSAPLPEHDTGAIRRLLSLCNYRHALPMPGKRAAFSGGPHARRIGALRPGRSGRNDRRNKDSRSMNDALFH